MCGRFTQSRWKKIELNSESKQRNEEQDQIPIYRALMAGKFLIAFIKKNLKARGMNKITASALRKVSLLVQIDFAGHPPCI